jgi:hypothetical protein
MKFHKLPFLLVTIILAASSMQAATLPEDHPTAGLVKKYIEAVVNQDWTTCAEMLMPASLELHKNQIIEAIKRSPTISAEAAALGILGLKDIRDLEKLTPKEVYIADRKAVYKRLDMKPEVLKRKQETLKINILGLVPEDGGKIIHALVRTSQDTQDTNLAELILLSVIQDKDDAKKWLINPDMQKPLSTPLKK